MKRRRNGEGSIFQVSESKWVAKISLGKSPDGKPRVKQFSGKTRAIVKNKLRDFKKSNDFVEKRLPSKYTVQSYFSIWLKEYQFNKLKPLSFDRLESTVVNHIYPHLGSLKLDQVTRDRVQTLINDLYKKKNFSYSSVKKVYVALNSCYNHALMDDVVIKNPCVGIVLPSPTERTKLVTTLSLDEVERLKSEILKTTSEVGGYGYAFLLILNTGLRMSEALSLCWEDIDFNNKTISVQKSSILCKKRDADGNQTGGYERRVQNSTKTSNSNRIIPINRAAEEALLELQKNNMTPYVIVNSKQKPVSPSNFERYFNSLLRKADIQNCGLHVLRHTFASLLFSKGVDVKVVSELLGHSTVKITYDTYVHLFEQDINRATSALD